MHGLKPSRRFLLCAACFAVLLLFACHSGSSAAPATPPPSTDTVAPSVPGGLTSPSHSANQVQLAWTASTDNVGVTGYKVYRGVALLGQASGTAYTDTGLQASTTYSYQVCATDAAGNDSAKSPALSVTTSAPPPPGSGHTYYVDPSGDDANDGSAAHPFRTLQHAADVVTQVAVAGGLTVKVGNITSARVSGPETVIVRAGSYAGFQLNWDTPVAGSASAPITFQADPGAVITSRNGKTADGIDLEPGSAYVTISGFTIINGGTISRAGIRVCNSDHVSLLDNVSGNHGTWGIFTSHADNLLIQGNETYGSVLQHGIYVSNACVNPTVRANRSHDNAGCGLHFNGDSSQDDATFVNWNTGLITGALVENNTLFNNGTAGGSAINMDGVQNATVRNNLLYNNHASGIAMFRIDGAQGPKNNAIYHNTIDMAANGRWAIRLDQLAGTVTLRNNILYHRNSGRGGIDFTAAADVALTDSDYNLFGGGGPAVTPDDATGLTLAQWQAQGKDAHSLTGTLPALFINGSGASGADYHLAPGSPAIDKGQTLPSVTQDLEGKARPAGTASDIGVYEYGT
ncbi:MAG: right-handed parallel beta-helix repeat-containing protein [Holophagaceae bacterium]|uniref:Right-handed parallel beta-helix repeat-containing protein n=1 Tax=Candidatus Geothrix skivensis TaxID=2954439 RepID=A0A9D7XJN0_9BACT|nr:right-handed parallel beta-helix repeat-containing protein [Candidatus Geothrix skivensis]